MHGNVWEWTKTTFTDYSKEKPRQVYVYKGGSYRNNPTICRAANKGCCINDYGYKALGFRFILIEKQLQIQS